MEITNYIIPLVAFIIIMYDTAYMIHCIKHKQYSALFGIILLIIMICAGTVIVELPYIS